MLKHILVGSALVLSLTSCHTHPATETSPDSLKNPPADSGNQKMADSSGTLTITPAQLKKYQEACAHDTVSSDKRFISNFFDIIKKFDGKRPDTTLLTTGNLDGDNDPDSIFTRVYYDSNTVYVESKWIKNNQVLWKEKYTDPYSESDAGLFDSRNDNSWVCLAVGILYGPPEIVSRNDTAFGAMSVVYDQGVDDLKNAGIHIDKDQYKSYLQDFKGDVLDCGEPNSREGLWIWYKPASRMITYYHP